jgi:hypothetical protein
MPARVALDRASVIAWVTWCGYTLGCAWPMWTVAPWVYGVAWLAYGALARRTGSALCAGASAACVSAPLFRVAVDDHGLVCAGVGWLIAAAVCMSLVMRDPPVDAWGQMPSRQAASLLWLATTAASVWGLMLADVVAVLARVLP